MSNFLEKSLKRSVNRAIQRQVNHGVDNVFRRFFYPPNQRTSRRMPTAGRYPNSALYPNYPLYPSQPQFFSDTENLPTHDYTDDEIARYVQLGDDDNWEDEFEQEFYQEIESLNADNLASTSPVNQARSGFDAFNLSRSLSNSNLNQAFNQNNFLENNFSQNNQQAVNQPMNQSGATTMNYSQNFSGNFVQNTQSSASYHVISKQNSINNEQCANACYELIDNKANSNAVIQGASGFFGLLATVAVDVGTIPLIYATMWNEIRAIYGQSPIDTDDALKVIANIIPEVLSDAIFDKVLGNVPVIGVYFNAICAKQMTWRLGTLFTLLSARGHEVHSVKCKEAMMLIRHMFPQKDMFSFTTPDHSKFIQITTSVKDTSVDKFNDKVESALNVFMNV